MSLSGVKNTTKKFWSWWAGNFVSLFLESNLVVLHTYCMDFSQLSSWRHWQSILTDTHFLAVSLTPLKNCLAMSMIPLNNFLWCLWHRYNTLTHLNNFVQFQRQWKSFSGVFGTAKKNSAVPLTLLQNSCRCLQYRTKMFSSVLDSARKLFCGINDAANFFCCVKDTAAKKYLPVVLTLLTFFGWNSGIQSSTDR